MGTQPQLQTLLEQLLGPEPEDKLQVYFQGPGKQNMVYPCIVYKRDFAKTQFADNGPYRFTFRYQVTVIAKEPDSEIPAKVAALPMSTYLRGYPAENLNHDVFTLYF